MITRAAPAFHNLFMVMGCVFDINTEPTLTNDVSAHPEASPVTFHLVEQGTKRRKTMLVDSLGFTHNVNSKRSYATYWQCTVRPNSRFEIFSGYTIHILYYAGVSIMPPRVLASCVDSSLVGIFRLSRLSTPYKHCLLGGQ